MKLAYAYTEMLGLGWVLVVSLINADSELKSPEATIKVASYGL